MEDDPLGRSVLERAFKSFANSLMAWAEASFSTPTKAPFKSSRSFLRAKGLCFKP
jgi:hypothetical protein